MYAACNNDVEFLTHLNNTDVHWDPLGPELQRHQLFKMLYPILYHTPGKTTLLKHTYLVHGENSLSFTHPAATSKGNTNAFLR